jgi:uncharacterized membrane protein
MSKTIAALLWLLVMCISLAIIISPLAAVISFFAVSVTFYLFGEKNKQRETKDSINTPKNE